MMKIMFRWKTPVGTELLHLLNGFLGRRALRRSVGSLWTTVVKTSVTLLNLGNIYNAPGVTS